MPRHRTLITDSKDLTTICNMIPHIDLDPEEIARQFKLHPGFNESHTYDIASYKRLFGHISLKLALGQVLPKLKTSYGFYLQGSFTRQENKYHFDKDHRLWFDRQGPQGTREKVHYDFALIVGELPVVFKIRYSQAGREGISTECDPADIRKTALSDMSESALKKDFLPLKNFLGKDIGFVIVLLSDVYNTITTRNYPAHQYFRDQRGSVTNFNITKDGYNAMTDAIIATNNFICTTYRT